MYFESLACRPINYIEILVPHPNTGTIFALGHLRKRNRTMMILIVKNISNYFILKLTSAEQTAMEISKLRINFIATKYSAMFWNENINFKYADFIWR